MRIYQRALAWVLIVSLFADTVALQVWAQEEAEAAEAEAPDSYNWPRDVPAKKAKVEVYQPQPETFEGNRLTARAAVSVLPEGESAPVFGVVWLEARVSTDRDERVVRILEIKVPKMAFPDAKEEHKKQLARLLELEMAGWAPDVSLDRLMTSLDTAEVRQKMAKDLKDDPPKILFVTEPTELVILDGQPELRPVEDSKLMKVINTIHLIVLDPRTKAYYLNLGKIWMTAVDLKEEWKLSDSPPAEVVKMTPKPDPDAEETDEGIIPKVAVVNEAVALITTDGEPKYQPLEGNELLFVSNTEETVLLEMITQHHFALVSGRWFRSKSFQGPWTYVAPDKLPASFGRIPADSSVGDVRAFVAGTTEAKDAVMDAQIPQTAAIKRDDKSLKVTYDGEPKFKPIEKTELEYAVNTQDAVIKVTEEATVTYYCCHSGAWFVSASPLGPWAVAIKVPQAIYSIPPSCPVYNVTYVYVYGHTPEVVYVGYTPGYNSCYVYNGTVVYGTGYTYTVWVGTVYYARPVTYGYTYRYYPALARWFSPFSIGGVVRRTRRRTRRRHRRYAHHRSHHRHNHYNRHRNRVDHKRTRSASQRNRASSQANRARTQGNRQRKNNVYGDRNGNVHRRNDNGSWQKRSNKSNSWSGSNRSSGMQRDHSARQRGSSRTRDYNRSRSSSRSSGSRGGSRGGGRRR